MKKRLITLLVLWTVGALIMADASADGRAKLAKLGFSIPPSPVAAFDFAAERLEGGTVKLSSLRGKVVILNFWATWCPPCREEFPSLQKLHKSLGDLPITIVALDIQEAGGDVEAFRKARGFTFPMFLDSKADIAGKYGITVIPTTFIIDQAGKVVASREAGFDFSSPAFLEALKTLAGK